MKNEQPWALGWHEAELRVRGRPSPGPGYAPSFIHAKCRWAFGLVHGEQLSAGVCHTQQELTWLWRRVRASAEARLLAELVL